MRKRHEAPLSPSQRIARFLFMLHIALYLTLWLFYVAQETSLLPPAYWNPNFLILWTPILMVHVYLRRKEPSAADSVEVYREGYREGFRDATQREASPASLGRLAMSEDGELSDEWIDHVSGKIKRG